MDIISHGLWGGAAFGRKSRGSFWLAFLFGVMPDIFSFGILWAANILGISQRPNWENGSPDMSLIPEYVGHLYNVTHSLIIFSIVFAVVWFILKRPLWELSAWSLHIVFDIFTHSSKFFPTPFLWPVSDFKVNSISWASPYIFFPDVALLIVVYTWFFIAKRRKKK